MIVGCISSESRTSSGSSIQNPGIARYRGFAIYERVINFFLKNLTKIVWFYIINDLRFLKRCSLKIRFNEPISVNIGS